MGGALHVEPLFGVDLVGADDGAYLVVEDLGRRSRQGAETGRLQLREEVGIDSPSVAAPCVTSSAEKAWMCMSGTTALIARQIVS